MSLLSLLLWLKNRVDDGDELSVEGFSQYLSLSVLVLPSIFAKLPLQSFVVDEHV